MIKKYKYIFILSMLAILSSPANIHALEKVDKIPGKNIYELSANIASKKTYKSAVLVNFDVSVADSLSASSLAGAKDAVILPVSKDSIPSETRSKLSGVNEIYIIGKEAAVSKSVEEELSAYASVKRIGGDDRYETSIKTAEETRKVLGKHPQNVIYANGKNGEADVVSAAAVSYRDTTPILLVDGKKVETEMKNFSSKSEEIYAVGGEKVIPSSLYKRANMTERIRGDNRIQTNQKIIEKFYSTIPTSYYIVDSMDYKTAMLLSPIAENKPVALVDDSKKTEIIKNAKELTAAGTISENKISKAVTEAGGIDRFDYKWTSNRYIAHAMGGIDGKTYTNSYEAMDYNYKNGHRVFEADLIMGGYGEFFIWHSFDEKSLAEMGLPTSYAQNRPGQVEFKNMKPYGKYTTMFPEDIFKYMAYRNDMYLVVDLKSRGGYDIFTRYSYIVNQAKKYGVIDRVIPQVYDEDSYNKIMEVYKFKSAIYTCYSMSDFNADKVLNFCVQNGIKVLTVDGSKYSNYIVNKCNQYGIKLYMNTYNNINEINNYKSQGVYGFYTDFVTP